MGWGQHRSPHRKRLAEELCGKSGNVLAGKLETRGTAGGGNGAGTGRKQRTIDGWGSKRTT